MRLPQYLPNIVAFVLAAAISLIGATFSARAIETVSASAVQKMLAIEGFDWVEVETDGLQVVLSGTAPDESTQLAAQRSAGHVVDPARVINVMDLGSAGHHRVPPLLHRDPAQRSGHFPHRPRAERMEPRWLYLGC